MMEHFYDLVETTVPARKKRKLLDPVKQHYLYITDLSRLLRSLTHTSGGRKKEICPRCLHYFYTKNELIKHEEDCSNLNKYRVRLPDEDSKYIKFKNHHYQEKMLFVIYADFESLLKKTLDEKIVQEHEAFSVGYYIKCIYDDSLLKKYYLLSFLKKKKCKRAFVSDIRGEDTMYIVPVKSTHI